MSETYQTIYEKLLSCSQLQPLTKFKSSKSFNIVYPDALKYPDFFNNNLLSQGRVIKVVRGKSAILRAFCYQLMKLTFEMEITDVDYVQVFKNVVFHPDLLLEDTEMQSPSSGRTYTDRQYKRIIADFVVMVTHQNIPNFEMTIMEYPIVEQAMIRIMQSLILHCYPGDSTSKVGQLLQWLSKTFQIGVQKHGKCYKFQQSDIFIYHENDEESYIAFLNEMAEVSDYSQSTYHFEGRHSREDLLALDKQCKNSSPQLSRKSMELEDYQIPIHPSDKYRYSAQIYSRRSDDSSSTYRKTIENHKSFIKDLAREVDESVHDKPSDKNSKIGSLLDIMSDRSSKELNPPSKTPEGYSSAPLSEEERIIPPEKVLKISQDSEQLTPQFTTNSYLQEDHSNPFTKKYSEQYMGHLYEKNQEFGFKGNETANQHSPLNFEEYSLENNYKFDTISYQIRGDEVGSKYGAPNTQYQRETHSFNALPQFNTLIDSLQDFKPKQHEDDDLIYKPKPTKPTVKPQITKTEEKQEDSRGSLYREFTDTRVLKAMTSIQRLKINQIRQKYRGKHRKDITNIY